MKNTKKRLVTHNGAFHADDLFACATLILIMQKEGYEYEIVRTRDMEVIQKADYVFDVGGIYDSNTNRYDHHQKDSPEGRTSGIPYASFGLVWKHFGMTLCGDNKDVWEIIDNEIASPIDANDNGIDIVTLKFKNVKPYAGSRVFTIYEPTWKETENHIDQIFIDQAVKVALVLKREIEVAIHDVEGINLIKQAYQKAEDKRIVILDNSLPRYLYQQVLSSFSEPIYLISPSSHGPSYKVEAITKSPETMQSRKPFPVSWRGILGGNNNALQITGLEGVYFVHNSGFLANLDTKENALKFAYKSLSTKEGFSFKKLFTL